MFHVDLLPAQRGDCLWITYGEPGDLHHVIVDAGPAATIPTLMAELEGRLVGLGSGGNRVELLAMSHVDLDHIEGVVSLLSDTRRLKLFRDIWFNGFEHLAPHTLGGPAGEMLTRILENDRGRWNKAFGGKAVVVPDGDGDLPTHTLAGGLKLTLLSPTPGDLEKLIPEWEEDCRKAGLIAGKGADPPPSARRSGILGWNIDLLASAPYSRDKSKPNRSSIAFIATYDGKSLLCTADAHSEVLEKSLERLGPGPHKFTAVKACHHGSKFNLRTQLLERIRSKHWLISTNGAQTKHPHPETLARIITTQQKPTFHLNYVTDLVQDLIGDAGARYTVKLPPKRGDGTYEAGIRVKLG